MTITYAFKRWVVKIKGKSQTFCSSVDVTDVLRAKAVFCLTFGAPVCHQVNRVIFLSLGENKASSYLLLNQQSSSEQANFLKLPPNWKQLLKPSFLVIWIRSSKHQLLASTKFPALGNSMCQWAAYTHQDLLAKHASSHRSVFYLSIWVCFSLEKCMEKECF